MIVDGVEVESLEHLEQLIIIMDEESKQGLRDLYQEEVNNSK